MYGLVALLEGRSRQLLSARLALLLSWLSFVESARSSLRISLVC